MTVLLQLLDEASDIIWRVYLAFVIVEHLNVWRPYGNLLEFVETTYGTHVRYNYVA